MRIVLGVIHLDTGPLLTDGISRSIKKIDISENATADRLTVRAISLCRGIVSTVFSNESFVNGRCSSTELLWQPMSFLSRSPNLLKFSVRCPIKVHTLHVILITHIMANPGRLVETYCSS